MAIRYALFENKMLHASDNEYMARTRAIGTADFDTIAARMVEMGTTVTKSDILAVFEDMSNAAESLLLDGFCNMKCSIKGIFAGPTIRFFGPSGLIRKDSVNGCKKNGATHRTISSDH